MEYMTDRDIEHKIVHLIDVARRVHDIPVGTGAKETCRRLGLRLESRPLPPDQDGLREGKLVVLNSTVRWGARLQFTAYHEAVHYLLDEDGELIEYFTAVLRKDAAAYKAAIERCCDIGAAEFLLPRAEVRKVIEADGLSVALVVRLASVHGSSLVASAIQLAMCAPCACYVVVCGYGPIPRSMPPCTGLYLEYAPRSSRTKYPLARFTPIPREHLLRDVWEQQVAGEGSSYVPFRLGARMDCYCEALPVGGRVAAVLYLDQPVPEGQLGLPF